MWCALVGTRTSLRREIARIGGIAVHFLKGGGVPRQASVAQRMSWASDRYTSRSEDAAYCLLGLFEVNMPLLYGEGAERAFFRLQQRIIAQSTDKSIFA